MGSIRWWRDIRSIKSREIVTIVGRERRSRISMSFVMSRNRRYGG